MLDKFRVLEMAVGTYLAQYIRFTLMKVCSVYQCGNVKIL